MKVRRCEDEKMICVEVKMRSCEDEKMIYRPPLVEESFAQTLSEKNLTEKLSVGTFFGPR